MIEEFVVCVCGGRDFGVNPFPQGSSVRVAPDAWQAFEERATAERNFLNSTLDSLHAVHGFTKLIHGGAAGADTHAGAWAIRNGIAVQIFPADWRVYGRRAGPVRNVQMLREGKPRLVVSFPGGTGTRHMRTITKRAAVSLFIAE